MLADAHIGPRRFATITPPNEEGALGDHSAKELQRLKDYRECADRLFAVADPRAIEDAARTLALYVGSLRLLFSCW